MKLYKLTEQEARQLAWELTHQSWTPAQKAESDHKSDIVNFMSHYNIVMNAIDAYNATVEDG